MGQKEGTIKRRPLTPHLDEIKISDEQRLCPVCKPEHCTIGHVNSMVVECIPARIEVIEYLREKVACRPCQGEVTVASGPPKKLIDRAIPGPRILAAIIVQKAVDGLPLNRIQKTFTGPVSIFICSHDKFIVPLDQDGRLGIDHVSPEQRIRPAVSGRDD